MEGGCGLHKVVSFGGGPRGKRPNMPPGYIMVVMWQGRCTLPNVVSFSVAMLYNVHQNGQRTDGALSFSMGETLMKPPRILCTLWVLCTSSRHVGYPGVAGIVECTRAIDSVVLFRVFACPAWGGLLFFTGATTPCRPPYRAPPLVHTGRPNLDLA